MQFIDLMSDIVCDNYITNRSEVMFISSACIVA